MGTGPNLKERKGKGNVKRFWKEDWTKKVPHEIRGGREKGGRGYDQLVKGKNGVFGKRTTRKKECHPLKGERR